MADLGNYELRSQSGGSGAPGGAKRLGPMVALVSAMIVFAGLMTYWLWGRGSEEAAPPVQTAVEEPPRAAPPEPVAPAPEPGLFELPSLGDSDSVLRDLATALSAHPGLAAWLVSDGLIRRFVVVVDNVADGRNPSQHLPFMKPGGRFETTGSEPELHIDPASFRRYDRHAQIVVSLDTEGTAMLYLTLLPLMNEAYAQLGYPDTPFTNAVERAVIHLLEAPIVEDTPKLVRRVAFHEYLDDTLESLTPAQKQFMSMGPDNMRPVQAKLREIATAIGISIDRLRAGSPTLAASRVRGQFCASHSATRVAVVL